MTPVTAFSFSNLPLIAREQVQLSQALSACLPGPYWETTIAEILPRALHKYLPGQKRLMFNFRIGHTTDTSKFIEKNFVAGEQEVLTLGRNPACELQLADPVVSSQHARIMANKQGLYLIDQSVNGTLLNGKRLPNKIPVALNHGDIIGIHPFQILFTISQNLAPENLKINFKTENIREITLATAQQQITNSSPLVVFNIDPTQQAALLQLDPDFVNQLVHLLIGQQLPNNNKLRQPLSNVEAALVEFLLLQVIKELRAVMSQFANFTIYITEFYCQANQAVQQLPIFLDRDLASSNTSVPRPDSAGLILQTTFQLTIGDLVGYLDLYLPQKLLQVLSGERPAREQITGLHNWLHHYGQLTTDLIVMAGELQLSTADLPQLEPMDIVLLANTQLYFLDRELLGPVTAWLGQGGTLAFQAELVNAEHLKILLQQVYHHAPEPTSKGELLMSDNTLDDTDALAGIEYAQAVPLTIAVELGRCNLTLAEVTRLRLGQILNLRRTPQEPVDLTIDGKLIGKGELVNIEGEIGVRILQLQQFQQ